jgi:hypothetical protein
MAGLTKNILENKIPATDRMELKYQSIVLYMDYCLNQSNHVKSYKQLENLVKARDKGMLRNYIED